MSFFACDRPPPYKTNQDVVAVVLGAFRQPPDNSSSAFTLVSLGGTTNLKRKALGGEGTRNLTLSQLGLSPPAATLLLQWKGKRGEDAVFPKVRIFGAPEKAMGCDSDVIIQETNPWDRRRRR